MGIIKRQGIKQSIVTYAGVGVGVFSTLVIYPLSLEIYGLLQLLLAISTVLIPFASIGIAHVAVKFFPEFQNQDKKHGLLGFLVRAQLIWFLMFLGILYLIKDYVIEGLGYLNFNQEVIVKHQLAIIVLCFLQLSMILLTQYISNFNRIVIPAIINNLWVRLAIPILVLVFYLNWIGAETVIWLFYLVFVLVVLGNLIYLKVLGHLDLNIRNSLLTKERLKRMWDYASFSMFSSLGTQVALRMDIVMVGTLIGITEVGVYSLMLFISNIIEIPYRSIKGISTPIISKSWENNDMEEIKKIYRKASQNLFFIGSFIFLLIMGSLVEVLSFTARFDTLITGVGVVLFLGLAKIVDMTLGVNTQILAMSKYYRFNLFALITLAGLNIYFNLQFIPLYGITGAALATLCSMLVYNIATMIFLYVTYKMHPFTIQTLKIALLFVVGYMVLHFMPEFTSLEDQSIITALKGGAIKSSVIVLIYAFGLFVINASPDMKQALFQILRRIKERRIN